MSWRAFDLTVTPCRLFNVPELVPPPDSIEPAEHKGVLGSEERFSMSRSVMRKEVSKANRTGAWEYCAQLVLSLHFTAAC